jgi:hypothetical protein
MQLISGRFLKKSISHYLHDPVAADVTFFCQLIPAVFVLVACKNRDNIRPQSNQLTKQYLKWPNNPVWGHIAQSF